jgi:hypothetical protein
MEVKEFGRIAMNAATYKVSDATLDESLTSTDGSWSLKRAAESQN